MKLVTVAGPPSCGKTSVILRLAQELSKDDLKLGVIKFDCLSSEDELRYDKAGIPVKLGLAGGLCPDHFFVANIEEGVRWGQRNGFDLLICESAGLCNRCSPHIRDVLAVCVVDNLSGVHTPAKIGPMLKTADVVVITKGDVVSQAEREVFAFRVKQVNPRGAVLPVNGLTGQGSLMLHRHLRTAPDTHALEGVRLRFSMPAALCSYCLGETRIGPDCQIGNIKTMDFS
ncbi:GTPase, putative [Syntrophotalea carbinolica DSM 2380]|uniref:GTPase, putative n=1 Tax=Syntrophotalea carbinolica (strain DSM 2380 / NBRC 103641 / GraBd1) TaxID=338963 RepID=Q3A2R2_SYNC1|nr:GTP-binding protein [Syntrophotalea carbinolica]ABA89345.1 GTPase, putative [Syntrophotalea carbinolica DSM 2380]